MLKFDEKQLIDWTQGIRENPDMLNAFWPSQIRSKIWLTDWVKSYLPSAHKIIIFGSCQLSFFSSVCICINFNFKMYEYIFL